MNAYVVNPTVFPLAALVGPYAVGDVLYADSTSSLARLADVATGSVLVSGGVGVAPSWSSTPTVAGLTVTGTGATALVVEDASGNDALVVNTTSRRVGIGGAPSVAMDIFSETATTNTTVNAFRFTLTCSGTVVDGFGLGLRIDLEDAAGATVGQAGAIQTTWEDATAQSSRMRLRTLLAGSQQLGILLDPNNNVVINKSGPGTGATSNLVFGGGSTSPVLGAAFADAVSVAAVDNGGGNRELQVQPESGGIFALGNNKFRRVPKSTGNVEHWTTTANSTDATITILAIIPITADYTYFVDAWVCARRTGGASGTANDGASYHRRGTYTTKAGTVTLMGAVQVIGTDAEDQAAWDCTLAISSTNVQVRVTGAAGNNITWDADITVRRVSS